jgi:V/A-type H+-transporting ATPase subunit E
MLTGIHAIVQKIHIDAESDSADRYTRIKNSVDTKISAESTAQQDDYVKQREALFKHNELEYARMLERHTSRLNRELLAYQYELVDEIFNMAVSKLRNISKSEFEALLKSSVKGLHGKYTLTLGELSQHMLTAAEVDEVIKECTNLEIAFSKNTVPAKSGFILRDDRVEFNCLFEDLMDDIKNEQTAAIMNEVFGS